jgi:transketolase
MTLEIVTRPHLENLVAWAADKPQVLVLSADLTSSCEADGFRQAYPQRFFSMGMAEQNMMSFAGGLAREGFEPFVHTFAVFVTRRPFDQVAMSIAYPNLPVRLLGFLPGLTTPGGVTHQAVDDIALMRVLPNMTVLECGDATEVESVLDVAHAVDGPVYVRMLRGELPRLFPRSSPMRLGQARWLSRGDDLALITSGVCTEEGLRAAEALQRRGVSLTHLHLSTLKPLPVEAVVEAIEAARGGVVTLENHSVIGGLGSAVAEVMAEAGLGSRRLRRLGLQDTYAHGASRATLMREYGLDAAAVLRAAAELLSIELDLEALDLDVAAAQEAGSADEGRVEDL